MLTARRWTSRSRITFWEGPASLSERRMRRGVGPSEEARLFRLVCAAIAQVEELAQLFEVLRARVSRLEEARLQPELEARAQWRERTWQLRRRLWRGARALASEFFIR